MSHIVYGYLNVTRCRFKDRLMMLAPAVGSGTRYNDIELSANHRRSALGIMCAACIASWPLLKRQAWSRARTASALHGIPSSSILETVQSALCSSCESVHVRMLSSTARGAKVGAPRRVGR